MKSLSGVGLAMSVIFGCLLMALLAELYYLLWWKKRITNSRIEDYGPAKELFFMFCGKNNPSSSSSMKSQENCTSDNLVHEPQHSTTNRDCEEQSMEAELMALSLSGPARFLCTIKEETMEDLESEDGKCKSDDNNGRIGSRKGSRSRSLSDAFEAMETPFLTPIASPPYYTPPLTPPRIENNFIKSRNDAEFESFITIASPSPSPPPSFKFLRDAEEKAQSKKDEEIPSSSEEDIDLAYKDDENGSFITLVFPSREGENFHQYNANFSQCPSSSQVLPLASSPPTNR